MEFQKEKEVLSFIENIVLNAEKHFDAEKNIKITSVAPKEKRINLYCDNLYSRSEERICDSETIPEIYEETDKLIEKYCEEMGISQYFSELDRSLPQEVIEKVADAIKNGKLSNETRKLYEEYLHKYELYKEHAGTHTLSRTNEIMLNNEKLESTEEIIKYFINNSMEINEEKYVVDLSKRNISYFAQDRLLKSMYGGIPEIPDDDIKILKEYKQHLSSKYIEVLRGGMIPSDLSERVDSLLKLDEILKKFPEISDNIRVYRVGEGIGKSRTDGDKVLYSQVISTSTSREIEEIIGQRKILYQRDLEKGTKAIPLDLVLPLFNVGKAAQVSENELLLLPCTYEVRNLGENIVEMKNAKDINIDELLEIRLEEIKNKLQNKEEYRKELFERSNEENKYNNPSRKQEKLQDLFRKIEEGGKLEILKEQDKKIKKDKLQYDSDVHGKNHTRKVDFFALVLAQKMALNKRDTEILLTAVQNHDIGRVNDYEDTEHGSNSIKKVIEEDQERFENYTEEEVELIKFIISEHSKSSSENKRDLEKNVPEDRRQRYKILLDCMKDADKLDRVRISDLDPRRLALEESKTLVSAAYEANKYLPNILDTYDDEQLKQVESELEKVKRHKEQKFEKYRNKTEIEKEKTNDESDFIRKKFMDESEEKGILSKIAQVPQKIRNKLQEKMKGKKENGR